MCIKCKKIVRLFNERALAAAFLAALSTSCIFEYDHCPPEPASEPVVELSFTWPDSLTDIPAGMSSYFYPAEEESGSWLFNTNPRQAYVGLPEGAYQLVSFNADLENTLIQDTDHPTTISATTAPSTITQSFTLLSADDSIPEPSTAASQAVRRQPNLIYLARQHEINVAATDTTRVELSPRCITSTYNIRIIDVENLKSAYDFSLSLSGLASTYLLGEGRRAEGEPVVVGASVRHTGDSTLLSTLRTFGPAVECDSNYLSLYAVLRDGSHIEYRWNVTDQIIHPYDGYNLTIDIYGLKLPDASGGDKPIGPGGFGVGVDTWETVEIDIAGPVN